MKKTFLLLFLLTLFISSCDNDNKAHNTTITWHSISPLPQSKGLSAVFAGTSDSTLMVAGGCNFPNTPAACGGAKVYYDNIYTLRNGKWTQQNTKLPTASAYGVSISTPEGIYIIGGTADGKSSLRQNLLYKSGQIVTLPEMPAGADNMGGAIVGDNIYIAGGLSDGIPSNKVQVYNIKLRTWSNISPYPAQARVQPIVVAQNAAEEKQLYIIGGFNPTSKQIMTDGWVYSPGQGKWSHLPDAPVALNGGFGFPSGVHTILAGAGVNADKFSQGINIDNDSSRYEYMTHEPSWYRFNDSLYAYNTITESWCTAGKLPAARAGATIAKSPHKTTEWNIIGGETMPGVRSAECWISQTHTNNEFGWINWSVIAIYMLLMIGMGCFFMLRSKNTDDYFKAGGRLPWWAVSVSIFATMLSAITFMAIPAKTYATDWRYFLMAVTIFIAAFPVVRYYLPFFRRLNITSAYEYLELRFNLTIRLISSTIFIIFMIARMALVLYLPSLALTAATGIDIYICILLMSIITVVYSSIGGIEAVVWGDVVQGIILMGGAVFTLIFLIANTDGDFMTIAIENSKFEILNLSFDFTSATFWVVIIGGLANQIISYTSDQTVIQRYMTTKSEKQAGKSIITNGILSLFSSALFYAIGTALYAYFKTRPETLDISMPTADSVFPFFIMTQLPIGVAGILIAAIFAASMSTVSSNINSVATAFTEDILPQIRTKGQKSTRSLFAARMSSAIFGILGCIFALVMAKWNVLSLFDWFNSMLGLLTSGLGALFFMGIFFDRITGRDALCGFVLGTVVLVIITIYTNVSFLMYGIIGMACITVISLLISYILPTSNHLKNTTGLTWKSIKKLS